MIAINNKELLDFCQNCGDNITPKLAYEYSHDTKKVKLTDNSEFGNGDGFNVVNISVTDKFGNKKEAQITTEGGDVEIDLSTGFNLQDGFNIQASIVSDNREVADIAIYGVSSGTQDEGVFGDNSAPVIDVTGVTVSPLTDTVAQGATSQFAAVVAPSGASQAVVWSIETGTNLSIAQNGLVTVGADTTADDYTVTATSVADGTKTGTATLTVTS